MKLLFVALTALTISAGAAAQAPEANLTLSVGGGAHQLKYKLREGKATSGAGFTANARYSLYITRNFGITAGAGVSTYQGTVGLNFKSTLQSVDAEGDSYEHRTSYNQWKEKHSGVTLDIPLGVTFKNSLSDKVNLTYSFGALATIPLNFSYKVSSGSIVTSGYYSKWNVELFDIPEQGFRTYNERPSGEVSFRASVGLFADLGATFKLNDNLSLYAGGYANYGLTSMLKADNKQILSNNGSYQSTLKSELASKVRPLSLGVKIGVVWYR